MARTKAYQEAEVLEKALQTFWKHGYETTSMQQLESEMGINKFSIYASFGNKKGLFIQSLKLYQKRLNSLLDKLQNEDKGIEGIKTFFYDFIQFSKSYQFNRGCLILNTANEISEGFDGEIQTEVQQFTRRVNQLFEQQIKRSLNASDKELTKLADFLYISLMGMITASRSYTEEKLEDYIERTFKNF